jgi:hypothetical protein
MIAAAEWRAVKHARAASGPLHSRVLGARRAQRDRALLKAKLLQHMLDTGLNG